MKKSLIIVVIVAAVVLVALIFFGGKGGYVEQKRDEAIQRARQANLKVFVSETVLDILKYWQDESITISYADNTAIKQGLEAKLQELKERNNGQYEYRIYEEPTGDAAVKAGEVSSGYYVCSDTKDVTIVEISREDFEKFSACDGGSLK